MLLFVQFSSAVTATMARGDSILDMLPTEILVLIMAYSLDVCSLDNLVRAFTFLGEVSSVFITSILP